MGERELYQHEIPDTLLDRVSGKRVSFVSWAAGGSLRVGMGNTDLTMLVHPIWYTVPLQG